MNGIVERPDIFNSKKKVCRSNSQRKWVMTFNIWNRSMQVIRSISHLIVRKIFICCRYRTIKQLINKRITAKVLHCQRTQGLKKSHFDSRVTEASCYFSLFIVFHYNIFCTLLYILSTLYRRILEMQHVSLLKNIQPHPHLTHANHHFTIICSFLIIFKLVTNFWSTRYSTGCLTSLFQRNLVWTPTRFTQFIV